MKKIGVVLSGCGVFDGAEIHESVLTLLAIERAGAQAVCFAPDKQQLHVINHLSDDVTSENRNVLVESARIARGKISALSDANAALLDALIVPGGFGVAKNLSDFSTQGIECLIDEDLYKLTEGIYKQGKSIGFICIAPVLLPKLLAKLSDQPLSLTIGNDGTIAAMIDKMKGRHVICTADDIVVDNTHKIVTTPGYMLASSITEVARGIDKLVKKVIELTT